MSHIDEQCERLVTLIAAMESCIVAFSGGVDSAVVAKAAQLALGDQAVAVTAVSASLAAGELEAARKLAEQIGIRHEEIKTSELSQLAYTRNAPDRCFHCKDELYRVLQDIAAQHEDSVILSGTNADDHGDYRPGLEAAALHNVRAPLAECQLTKDDVRSLAKAWDLSVWDKPATPCLSSRIAYGQEVTPERLAQIDQAEQFLRDQGWGEVRVRYHRGDLARVEVPAEALAKMADGPLRTALVEKLRQLGFRYVTLDLEGFRSGSQNEVLPVELLEKFNG